MFETFREYEKLKENDRSVLKSMAEAQLKQVFDGVDAGTMKPAGVERKIEFHMVPPSNGGRAYERVMPTSNHSSGAFGSVGTFDAVPSPIRLAGFNNNSRSVHRLVLRMWASCDDDVALLVGGGGGGGSGAQHVPPSTPTFGDLANGNAPTAAGASRQIMPVASQSSR